MARKWTPASEDPAAFDRQFAAAREAGAHAAATEPRAESAAYDAGTRTLTVQLRNGVSFSFPVLRIPALARLPDDVLGTVRTTASGHGVHWDDADVHLAVPELVAGLFGRLAAQSSGRRGGKSRSEAKAVAARRNARLGGRPAARTETTARGPASVHVETRAGSRHRSVDVHVGGDYVVEPMNPAARRNRGRTGRVVGIGDARDGHVQLRFADTGRIGLVPASELVPVEEQSSAAD